MKHYDPNFKHYLISNFPEHARRIFKSHSKAWFARIFFPMIFFLIPASFFVIIAFFIYCIKQPNISLFPNQEKITELVQNIPLKSTLISIFVTGAIVSAFSFVIGLIIGFSRAHYLLFEAEKLELSAKQLWIHEAQNSNKDNTFMHNQPKIKSPVNREVNTASKQQEPEI